MTRKQLIDAIARQYPELSRQDCKRVVDTFFGEISAALAEGRRVDLRRFGNFETRQHKAKIARNPRTGELVPMAARHHVHFKASKLFVNKLNQQIAE